MLFGLNCFQYADAMHGAGIHHRLCIRATPAIVYHALTTRLGLSQWLGSKTNLRRKAGLVNLFDDETNAVIPMQFIALHKNKCVTWRCLIQSHAWTNTLITFEIIRKDEAVMLNFKHTGWAQQDDQFSACSLNWAMHLLWLKKYCETGWGKPETGINENWKELITW